MPKNLPSPELLRKLLRYEPETGKLFWRDRTPDMFEERKICNVIRCRRWNLRYAGKEAFAVTVHGYAKGSIFKQQIFSHRAIWAMTYNHWPTGQIDHIDGNRKNNRIDNLRDVTCLENRKNAAMRCNNSSGFNGVNFDESRGKWLARVQINGKQKNLGRFNNFDDAVSARKAADTKFGFHANHGRSN